MRTPESNYAAGLSEKSSLTLFDLVLAFYLPVSILYGHVGVGLALFLLLLLAFGIELSSRQYRPHNAPRLACVACSACLVILGVLHSLPMTDPLAVSRISVMFSNWVLMAVLLVRTSVGFSAWGAEAGLASTLLLIVAASWVDLSIVEAEASTKAGLARSRLEIDSEFGAVFNPNQIALLCGLAVCLSVRYLMLGAMDGGRRGSKAVLKHIRLIINLCSVAAAGYLIVFRLGSRQGFVWLVFAAICAIMMLAARKGPARGLLYVVALVPVLGIVIGVLAIQSPFAARLLAGFGDRGSSEVAASDDTRLAMARRGWELWLESPIIGSGHEAFRQGSFFFAYSHNNAIELMVSYGVVGILACYGPLLFAGVVGARGLRARNGMVKMKAAWISAVFAALIVSHMLQPQFLQRASNAFFGLLVGFGIRLMVEQKAHLNHRGEGVLGNSGRLRTPRLLGVRATDRHVLETPPL